MRTLRILIAALALIAFAGTAVVPAPGSYAIAGMTGIAILLLGCGSIAADALPLQRVPLVCSIATVPLAVLLIVQPLPGVVIAAAILGLQGAAWWRAA